MFMHIFKNTVNSLKVALLIVSTSTAVIICNQSRIIDVANDTAQALVLSAAAKDGFRLEHTVPAHMRLQAVIKLVELTRAQEMLFEAILQNSAHGVAAAVKAGVNVNAEINGQKPLFWAMSLAKTDAVRCLLNCGATC